MGAHFRVKWDNETLTFQEASGLDAARGRSVTLKRGVFRSTSRFSDWLNRLKTTGRRVPLTITLLDEAERPTMAWTLVGAVPTKVTGPDLQSGGNEVAIESLEISCDGLTITNP